MNYFKVVFFLCAVARLAEIQASSTQQLVVVEDEARALVQRGTGFLHSTNVEGSPPREYRAALEQKDKVALLDIATAERHRADTLATRLDETNQNFTQVFGVLVRMAQGIEGLNKRLQVQDGASADVITGRPQPLLMTAARTAGDVDESSLVQLGSANTNTAAAATTVTRPKIKPKGFGDYGIIEPCAEVRATAIQMDKVLTAVRINADLRLLCGLSSMRVGMYRTNFLTVASKTVESFLSELAGQSVVNLQFVEGAAPWKPGRSKRYFDMFSTAISEKFVAFSGTLTLNKADIEGMHRVNVIALKGVIDGLATGYFTSRNAKVWDFPKLPLEARGDLMAGELCDYLYAIVAFNLFRATEPRVAPVE